MYKIISEFKNIKVYWCTDFTLANEVAEGLKKRFRCPCTVIAIPGKTSWRSDSNNLRNYQLSGNLEIHCSHQELTDAVAHVHNNIIKINSNEIFCFVADDVLWQQQLH